MEWVTGLPMVVRLLLVNKGLPTAQIFKEVVSSVGAELMVIESFEQAARHIRDERFDSIFVDGGLPGLDCYELTRCVRKSKFNSRAPIFLMTGYRGSALKRAEVSSGISTIEKPSTAGDLQPLLQRLLRKLAAERRKNRRLEFRTLVNCVEGQRRFRGVSVNLSSEGLLMEASTTRKLGDEFEVYFHLTSGEPPFRARVRVVRMGGPNRMGLAFQNVGSVARDRLRRFLDLHSPSLG